MALNPFFQIGHSPEQFRPKVHAHSKRLVDLHYCPDRCGIVPSLSITNKQFSTLLVAQSPLDQKRFQTLILQRDEYDSNALFGIVSKLNRVDTNTFGFGIQPFEKNLTLLISIEKIVRYRSHFRYLLASVHGRPLCCESRQDVTTIRVGERGDVLREFTLSVEARLESVRLALGVEKMVFDLTDKPAKLPFRDNLA